MRFWSVLLSFLSTLLPPYSGFGQKGSNSFSREGEETLRNGWSHTVLQESRKVNEFLSDDLIFSTEREVKSFLWVYSSSTAARTQYHGLGDSDSRDELSVSLGGWMSKPKVQTALVFREASVLGLKRAAFSLRHMASPLCARTPGVSSSWKDSGPIGLRPPP